MITKRYFTLILILLFVSFAGRSMAQSNLKAHFETSEHKVIIYYQFQGDTTSDYKVSIALKQKSNPDFDMEPKFLQGDLGTGKFANEERKIIWNLSEKEERVLTGDDYYFEVLADEKGGGGFMWIIYVALAIGGFFLI